MAWCAEVLNIHRSQNHTISVMRSTCLTRMWCEAFRALDERQPINANYYFYMQRFSFSYSPRPSFHTSVLHPNNKKKIQWLCDWQQDPKSGADYKNLQVPHIWSFHSSEMKRAITNISAILPCCHCHLKTNLSSGNPSSFLLNVPIDYPAERSLHCYPQA